MAVNIIDLVQRNLSGPVTRQISSLLGESEATTHAAVGYAVPTIVGALMKQASSPSGARELASHLDRTDTTVLTNLPSTLSSGAKSVMDVGASSARSLFGMPMNAVTDALSRASGMGKGAITSLLALVTPIVMSVVAKLKRDQGLDANGLASLLSGQSSYLAGLLPAGLAATLGINHLVDTTAGAARAGAGRVADYATDGGRAVPQTERATGERVEREHEGNTFLRRVLPIAALLLVAAVAWSWIARRSETRASVSPEVGGVATAEHGELNSAVDEATEALRRITDVESARTAVPKIENAARTVELLSTRVNAMPSSTRSALASASSAAMTNVRTFADRAMGIPGVSDVISPAVTSLVDALRKLRR